MEPPVADLVRHGEPVAAEDGGLLVRIEGLIDDHLRALDP